MYIGSLQANDPTALIVTNVVHGCFTFSYAGPLFRTGTAHRRSGPLDTKVRPVSSGQYFGRNSDAHLLCGMRNRLGFGVRLS